MSAIDHDTIERVLHDLSSTLGAAESHGLLCGMLCVKPTQQAKAKWFSELLDSTKLEAGQLEPHAHGLKQLEELFEASVKAINSVDMGFELLMPADSDSLPERTAALAGWCSGFCAGAGFGLNENRQLPEDTRELLADFGDIARADSTDTESSSTAADNTPATDEDELALAELVEYVRVGVLLVNEELQPAANPTGRVH